MADETFRPHKRPITHTPSPQANEAQNKLEQMAQIRQAAADTNATDESASNEPVEMGGDTGSFAIQGHVPPQFQQALRRAQEEEAQDEQPPQAPRPRTRQQPQMQQYTNQSADMRITGSNKLEELLAGIRQKAGVYEKIELPSKGKFYDGTDGPNKFWPRQDLCVRVRLLT